MLTFARQIDGTSARLMAVAFIGIHLPMVSLILFGLVTSFSGLGAVLLTVLGATLLSTLATIAVIYRITRQAERFEAPQAG